jgi:hypothetical protein
MNRNLHWPTEKALRLLHGPDRCETCQGRGWVAVEDPLYPGALIDARCPECGAIRRALKERGE